MKKIIVILVSITVMFAGIGDFIDSAINTATNKAGYYHSQTRGIYTLGSFKATIPNQGTFSPVHVSLPSVKVGCGGIDAVFGGFSYLGADYLVAKLKAISASAPAFAFQLALSALYEEAKTTLNWLENAANLINNFNMNTCKASQRIVFGAAKLMGMANANMSSGQSNNFIKETTEIKTNANNTFTKFLANASYYLGSDNFAKEVVSEITLLGSLVQEAVENTNHNIDVSGFGKDPNNCNLFTSIVRAFAGDIIGYRDNSNDKGNFKLIYIPAKIVDVKKFIDGGYIPYVCVKPQNDNLGEPTIIHDVINFDGIRKIFEDKLNNILNQMKNREKISDSNRDFINSLPMPIYRYLNTELLLSKTSPGYTTQTEFIAKVLAIDETRVFFNYVFAVASKVLSYKIAKISNKADFEDIKEKLSLIISNLRSANIAINKQLNLQKNQFELKIKFNDYYKKLEQRIKAQLPNNQIVSNFF